MSYDAVIAARKAAEAKMTDEFREGIRLGLKMKRECVARKMTEAKTRSEAANISFGGELPEIAGLRWLRPGGLMPNVIRAETAAGDYYITNGDRIAVSGPLAGHFGTVEDAVAAVARHHAANVSTGTTPSSRNALSGGEGE